VYRPVERSTVCVFWPQWEHWGSTRVGQYRG
jgi:hypothetical protein